MCFSSLLKNHSTNFQLQCVMINVYLIIIVIKYILLFKLASASSSVASSEAGCTRGARTIFVRIIVPQRALNTSPVGQPLPPAGRGLIWLRHRGRGEAGRCAADAETNRLSHCPFSLRSLHSVKHAERYGAVSRLRTRSQREV